MTGATPHPGGEIPFDQAPGLAELAERADRHERLRLVRGGVASALVVMTEDDYDQAVQDTADLQLCRELLSRIEPLDSAQAEAEHAATVAFLDGILSRTSRP
ncbi:MAG TPA: hypothetical protein VLJ59_06565 [Mycobacteriales bacterium]|nr:hypothetical protein [Mycobacteriales bacterium]